MLLWSLALFGHQSEPKPQLLLGQVIGGGGGGEALLWLDTVELDSLKLLLELETFGSDDELPISELTLDDTGLDEI